MKKYIPSEEEIKTILKMYNDDLIGSQTISEKIGLNKQQVLRILKENGVKLGPSGRRNIGGKKVSDKKWREKNKETLKEKWLSYYYEYKDIIKEKGKDYRIKTKDVIKERVAKYYNDNIEVLKEKHLEYYKNNKETLREN